LSVSGKESVPPGELFLAVAVGFLRRSDSRGSIHRTSQARASKHASLRFHPMPSRTIQESHRPRVSDRTMRCHLKWITVRLDVSETNGAVTTVKWNHRGEEGSQPFRVTKRITKLRRLSKTTRSRVHVQTRLIQREHYPV
jgi:hypothetical protein